MAKVRNIIKGIDSLKVTHVTEVDMEWAYSDDNNYLILRTFGSDTRKLKGKASQAIHLDKEKAQELIDILKLWV